MRQPPDLRIGLQEAYMGRLPPKASLAESPSLQSSFGAEIPRYPRHSPHLLCMPPSSLWSSCPLHAAALALAGVAGRQWAMMSASTVRRPWVGEEGEDFIIVLFEIQLYSDSK